MRLIPLMMVISWPWRINFQQLGIILARRLVAERSDIADTNGILRIKADDAVILDIDARHAVAGGRDDERVVKADFERSWLDFTVPIHLALSQAKVPFADDDRGVPNLFQN